MYPKYMRKYAPKLNKKKSKSIHYLNTDAINFAQYCNLQQNFPYFPYNPQYQQYPYPYQPYPFVTPNYNKR